MTVLQQRVWLCSFPHFTIQKSYNVYRILSFRRALWLSEFYNIPVEGFYGFPHFTTQKGCVAFRILLFRRLFRCPLFKIQEDFVAFRILKFRSALLLFAFYNTEGLCSFAFFNLEAFCGCPHFTTQKGFVAFCNLQHRRAWSLLHFQHGRALWLFAFYNKGSGFVAFRILPLRGALQFTAFYNNKERRCGFPHFTIQNGFVVVLI